MDDDPFANGNDGSGGKSGSCHKSVFRPLIGWNKENIIKEAQRIGTYEVSIQPYEDCCMLFSPPHPVLYGDVNEACALYETLELPPLIDEALKNYELVR